jgi:FixJ family two-component response regulator
MTHDEHAVLVLDDDPSILKGLERLLAAHGYRVGLYSESEDFFRAGMPAVPACLILDNQLNDGMTGLQVHAEMQRRGWEIPTVFLTAHWNVQCVVDAMRSGADGFLTKPFDPAELVDAVAQALERARSRHRELVLCSAARSKAATLTAREKEIVRLVVSGLLNKEIADQLGLALVTVKVHRGRAMQKLGAGNPAELARIAALAGIVC